MAAVKQGVCMRSRSFSVLVLLLLLFAVPVLSASKKKGRPAPPPTLKSLSEKTYKQLAPVFAVEATKLGWHGNDMHLNDYSPKGVSTAITELSSLKSQVAALPVESLTADEQIDHQLLESQIDRALFDLKEMAWHRRQPQRYLQECYDGVAQLMYAKPDAKFLQVSDIIARISAIPLHLEMSRRTVRSAPAFSLLHSLSLCQQLTTLLAGVSVELSRKSPSRAREIDRVTSRAIQAITEHEAFLKTMSTASDEQLAIGSAAFAKLLQLNCFSHLPLDSIRAMGEQLLAEAQNEYEDYRLFVEESRQFGQDSIFLPSGFSRSDVLDYYDWEIEQVRFFLEANDIITVPFDDGSLTVAEAPPSLGGKFAPNHYFFSGAFDLEPSGYLSVRSMPDSLDEAQLAARYRYVHRRGFRSSVVRDIFPGRHLAQLTAAGRDNAVRRWENSPMFLGGWSLYCEELCYQNGLYGGEQSAQWLSILDHRRWALVAMVAEIRLQTGSSSLMEVRDWMAQSLALESMAGDDRMTELLRDIVCRPGEQTAVVLGLLEIERLREAFLTSTSEETPEREFHDWLLSQGLVPPSLLQFAPALPLAEQELSGSGTE